MADRTDIIRRQKRYAMQRLQIAMQRLIGAHCEAERVMAKRWVNAWAGAIGERWFASIALEAQCKQSIPGWVVLSQSAERMLGLFATEVEARTESEGKPGSEYFFAFVQPGTDNYMRVDR